MSRYTPMFPLLACAAGASWLFSSSQLAGIRAEDIALLASFLLMLSGTVAALLVQQRNDTLLLLDATLDQSDKVLALLRRTQALVKAQENQAKEKEEAP